MRGVETLHEKVRLRKELQDYNYTPFRSHQKRGRSKTDVHDPELLPWSSSVAGSHLGCPRLR